MRALHRQPARGAARRYWAELWNGGNALANLS